MPRFACAVCSVLGLVAFSPPASAAGVDALRGSVGDRPATGEAGGRRLRLMCPCGHFDNTKGARLIEWWECGESCPGKLVDELCNCACRKSTESAATECDEPAPRPDPAPAPAPRPRVAIVGAGIGGSSVAWFLRDEPVDVVVFEEGVVGGRVRETAFPRQDPVKLEAGGSVIHSLNQYMVRFVEVLNGTRLAGDGSAPLPPVASWNGSGLAAVGPANYPLDLFNAVGMVTNISSRFTRIYDLQAAGNSFEGPLELLASLGLSELAQTSGGEWLRAGGVSAEFVRQFADGVSRVNYGQDSSLNAFAEAVSLAGAGLVGSLFGVAEGISVLIRRLIFFLGAGGRIELRRNRVSEVRASAEDGGYLVCTQGGACESFASVVIAAPLELANIRLDEALRPNSPAREYQVTVATFVAASGLSPRFFGTAPPPPDSQEASLLDPVLLLTTSNDSIPFNSASVHGVSGGRNVYKAFSRDTPPIYDVSDMFVNATAERQQFAWHACPVLRPRPSSPAFRLHRGERRTT